ncbi:MAG: decaprenyl-phosphate phosphoribosyltransferase [Chloroflexi bacterium]|nr:decaprenyl-phosphate phosphoribosyltransferase [Chloroflexota bacterium]
MIRDIFKAMRPRQWTKNGFIFAALVFDRKLLDLPSLEHTIATFFLFCLLSSSVYLLNDLMDIEVDRNHPIKKNRPIASGRLPIRIALLSGILLFLISLSGAYFLSFGLILIFLIYFFLNIAYSKWLKHIPIIDVLVIAACFVLRVIAGVSVIAVQRFSPWLYIVMTLLALYLGFGKRRAEMTVIGLDHSTSHRKVLSGYSVEFIDQLITIVSSTTIIAYSLYTFSAVNLPANHTMMLTIPFVLYGVFRYLYLIQIKKSGGEPEELLLRDRPLQITILLWAISIVIIFYI